MRQRWYYLGAAAILIIAGLLRFGYYQGSGHGDEDIALAVVHRMVQVPTWDTNWAEAAVPEPFHYNQYNFSSYHVTLSAIERSLRLIPGGERGLNSQGSHGLFRLVSAFFGMCVVALSIRLGKRFGGASLGLGTGAVVAVAPLLVQDSHYIRPETFVTALTLLLIELCSQRGPSSARAVAIGFIAGFLCAAKVSFLALMWLPLVTVLPWPGRKEGFRTLTIIGIAVVLGFATGVPGALLNPGAFLHGLRALYDQYSSLHPPHSHFSGGPVGDMILSYFASTIGWPAIVLGLIGGVTLAWTRSWRALSILGGPVVVFVGYFSTKSVFFERNLSHIVPLFLMLAVFGAMSLVARCGRPWRSRAILASLLGIALLYWPTRITAVYVFDELSGRATARQQEFETELRSKYPGTEWREIFILIRHPIDEFAALYALEPRPTLLKVIDYNDEWTAAHMPILGEVFVMDKIAERPGSFGEVALSTLHTYHRPRHHYFLVTGLR